ncbi:hypothetical protein ACFWRG_32725 [Micromonospora tulbaghiae]|uniref:hypothetical protein n=1 Tax=Micromonospora tulbaghiae TaxID=479978 RepID=UPI00364A10FE
MSTSQLAERPATLEGPAQRPGRAALRKARSRKTALLARYVGYVGYFVGAGLISGAVVHHPLDPTRYTRIAGYGVLIPAGIALSFLAFVIKDEGTSWRRVFGLAGLSVLVVVLISFFGLHQLASTLSEQPGAGGHGHGSGTEPQPEEQQSQLDRPGPAGSPEASTSPAAGEAPTETGSEDGHNH